MRNKQWNQVNKTAPMRNGLESSTSCIQHTIRLWFDASSICWMFFFLFSCSLPRSIQPTSNSILMRYYTEWMNEFMSDCMSECECECVYCICGVINAAIHWGTFIRCLSCWFFPFKPIVFHLTNEWRIALQASRNDAIPCIQLLRVCYSKNDTEQRYTCTKIDVRFEYRATLSLGQE